MIALIPAKGHSKRVPYKNKRNFCGLPLFEWSVIAALNSHNVKEVYVTTEDEEIGYRSIDRGANVIWRTMDDEPHDAPGSVPILRAMQRILKGGFEPGYVLLFPTAPLRYPHDIDRMVDLHKAVGMYPSSMARWGELHVWNDIGNNMASAEYIARGNQSLVLNLGTSMAIHDKTYEMFDADFDRSPQEFVHEVPRDYKYGKPTARALFYEMEWWQGIETDTESQFQAAEVLMEKFILRGRGESVYYEYGKAGRQFDGRIST